VRRRRGTILAALGLALAGCRTNCTPPPGPARTNVVLVTIDTLRADHLGCYGSRTARTPALDRLAAEGALFERCYAQTHVTVPSHLSILSSLPLASHGVDRNDATAPHRVTVLPDVFKGAGYRTAAFVGAVHVGPKGTLGPLLGALDVYRAPQHRGAPMRAEETNEDVFHWLRGSCRAPFFLWVHYFDPHMPYAPPAPWDTRYYDGDPRSPAATSLDGVAYNWFFYELGDMRALLGRQAAQMRALKQELGVSTRLVKRMLFNPDELEDRVASPEKRVALRERMRRVTDAVRPGLPLRRGLSDWLTGVRDLDYPLGEYAGEVSYTDEQLGRLRAELERLGIAARTALVVTADHGESLGEHGIYFDHAALHDQELHVPLVVWAPGRVPAGRHGEVVRSLDVAPTVLGLAGLSAPAAMQGRDLLAAGAGPEIVVSEGARGRQIMALDGRWKLIRTLKSFHYVDAFEREAGATELYDVESDPGERDDLAARRTDVAAALAAGLDRWIAAHPTDGSGAPAAPMPADVQRQLRALGYVE
jgi:arylsulfatase A-like enzyme